MKGPVYCLVGLLLGGLCSASPAGRKFATSFMQNLGRDGRETRFLIEVAALPSSQGSTKVKVSAMGEVYEKEINPGRSISFKLPDSVEMKGSTKSHQAVLIEASQDVTVMSLNFKRYTADTSVIYPVTDWGTEYYILTPSSAQTDTFKEFSITNYMEPNSVDIFLQGSVRFQGKYYKRGKKITLKLDAFETVQIQSQDNLRGTNVVSRLPVAVSSGHSCFQKYTACNHVYEQLLPVNSWGKEFIIAPLPYRNYYSTSYDSVFVQASQSTKITVNVNGRVKSYPMFAGQTLEFHSQWPHAMYLTSDKGIQVLFEFNGGRDDDDDDDEYFDPFLMTILPTSRFSTSYALEGQADFYNDIIVVAQNKDLDGIKIDPKPQSANYNWRKVDGTDFSWAEMYYSTGANFYQISHPNSPFGVYSFGVANANGYGSPAAADPAESCSTMKCSEDEVCQMKGNSPTCVKKPPSVHAGTCWAMGDPHYHTFDGNYYKFMGTCTYTMAKNCHVDEDHPAFEVDAQNNKRTGSKVTFVSKVIIKVYGYTVTIMRSEFGLVRMDHTLWNLPINLGNGKVKLSQSGLSVIVETDFGLTVQYDWKEYLVITVPGSFSGKVCGLCGNFNSKKEDDLMTPTGSQASSVVALGKSWRVPNVTDDAQCQDQCSGQCETCDDDNFFHRWAHRGICSTLTAIMDNRLSDCNAVIDPKVFHEMCLFDMCMGEGWNFLCNTLQVYADACQRAGIKIHDWRSLAHCSPPACPENSHYDSCGNPCPASCEDPDAATKCKKSCVETCVCDEGFLLSGTECVRKDQCGCMYKDKSLYIEAGASVFTDDRCTERCTCNKTTKEVDCEKPGCPQGYECKVVDDLIGCQPMAYAECSMNGGPHFETFDGHDYHFQGTCVYQLAGVCSKDSSLQQFEVFVQNDANGKRVGSGAKLVEVNVYGTSVVVTRKHKGSVLINGELTSLPVKVKHNFTVYQIGDFAEIKTEFGLQVFYDWQSTVHVKVPNTYADALCGLCGNYNDNPRDDLKLRNGSQAVSAEELGKSWRVAEIPGCVDGCKNNSTCPSCDITQKEKYETDRYCGLIRNPTGPFSECHAIKNPESFFKSCVYDVCLYNGKNGSWCGHLHSYTIECQSKGVNVSKWRRDDFCPVSKTMHPANSSYEHCADVCHATCDNGSPPAGCKRPCQEGWVCNDGFLLSEQKCVPLEQCGCMHNKTYYKREHSVLSSDCQKKWTCNGTMRPEPHSCGPFAECALIKGVRTCQPVDNGTCTILGDPHYKTFDNHTYDFQGTCTYTAAKSCHLEGSWLKSFSVVVENEKWTLTDQPNLAVAMLVAVEVYNTTLILRKNQLKTIMVNGVLANIPLNLNEGQVEVFQEGFHYAITTDFGLKVTYDMVYKVTVTVPGTYKDKTCGLCGNFNDIETDDFELPDGKITKDVQTFGAAWKKGAQGVVCEDGCSGDQCPKCNSTLKEIFEEDCRSITNSTGPFAACHSSLSPESYYRDCVYDVCMSQGDRNILCNSISAYVTDCQTIGVKIDHWRRPDFCPVSCSENSYYQICSETCGSPCPGLIDTITCPATCAEGCACNEGYYYNGTDCVGLEDCSCYHEGRTYKIGESALSDNCQQRCSCTTSGEVKCEDFSCGVTENCQLNNGSLGCQPKKCQMETGGSITLFSGTTGIISVMAAYEIITHCDESAADWFRVVAKLQECPLTGVKSVVAVYVYFNDLIVTVTDRQETWVNGKKVTLPSLPGNNIFVRHQSEKTIIIEQTSHFQLYYSNNQELVVTVSDSMADRLCGACVHFSPLRDNVGLAVEVMQEHVASFSAQDFPTCEL